jgi:hypothetical protein
MRRTCYPESAVMPGPAPPYRGPAARGTAPAARSVLGIGLGVAAVASPLGRALPGMARAGQPSVGPPESLRLK